MGAGGERRLHFILLFPTNNSTPKINIRSHVFILLKILMHLNSEVAHTHREVQTNISDTHRPTDAPLSWNKGPHSALFPLGILGPKVQCW